jgi:hypothetical protein
MKKIPPFRLKAEPLNEEAANLPKFEWAEADVGTRHKLGGEPDFIQRESWPKCPDCAEQMTFYAQLDSINDAFCIADVGMIFVFVCFDCYSVQTLIQSN